MKQFTFASAFLLLMACQSQVDTQPAAEVSETTAAAPTSTAPAQGASKVITEKSKIEFVGAKVTRDHDGGFRDFDGHIEYAGGQPSKIAFEIDLDSIYTDEEKLTAHLKTADFFDVAKYPRATFVSSSIGPAAPGSPAGTTHTVSGILDLHGQKKAVTIPVVAQQTADGVRTTSNFTINRHDWGISYRGMADDLIKDNVLIKLDLQFPPPPAAA
jgi:polyisoprenoid-binding protein YceI